MAVHKLFGSCEIVTSSKISLGGFDVKVKFPNGRTQWCRWEELDILN